MQRPFKLCLTQWLVKSEVALDGRGAYACSATQKSRRRMRGLVCIRVNPLKHCMHLSLVRP